MSTKSVLMMTDIEGVSGVVSFENQAYGDGKYYEAAKKILTAEINAAVDGLLEAGVEDVVVIDGHGPGAVHFESLHPEARLMHGRPISLLQECAKMAGDFDATIQIGQHARCGVPDGNLNHTQSSRNVEYYKLNGEEIGETAQWALFCGSFDLPLIFITGDEAACREAGELIPGITTAAVKKGLSRSAAISLSAPRAHHLIKEGAREAVNKQNEKPLASLKWSGPFVLEKRFLFTNTSVSYEKHPLLHKIIDTKTVQLKSDNIRDIIYA